MNPKKELLWSLRVSLKFSNPKPKPPKKHHKLNEANMLQAASRLGEGCASPGERKTVILMIVV